eukprot:1506456-Pyramimonas_sp.AAC.1
MPTQEHLNSPTLRGRPPPLGVARAKSAAQGGQFRGQAQRRHRFPQVLAKDVGSQVREFEPLGTAERVDRIRAADSRGAALPA